jgi:REP element-mobilizing transposase RayT
MKTAPQHRGWYSRGYIPHYDGGDIYQVITYRLADSLPKSKLDQFTAELKQVGPENTKAERRKKIEKWLDASHGSCILQNPACARIVIDAWKYFDGVRYDLAAWVVMPNHVHVLAYFRDGWPLAKVINSWKSFSARQINKVMQTRGDGATAPTKSDESRVWQRGYWDRYIRNEAHFTSTIQYIHHNPVTAGLVRRPEEWPFSSIQIENSSGYLKWRPPEKARPSTQSVTA